VSDLLHALRRAARPRPGDPAPLPPCLAAAAASAAADAGADATAALAGDAYYAAKASLIAAEASLLRAIRYDVGAADAAPHKHLYNLAAALRAPPPAVRLAAAALRDACLRSRAPQRHAPEVLAAGALHLASALLALPPLPPRGAAAALGLAGGDDEVDAAAAELADFAAAEARITRATETAATPQP
jgi:hypothetical protein